MNANFYEHIASRLHFHHKHQLYTYFDNKILKRKSHLSQSEFIMSNITLATKKLVTPLKLFVSQSSVVTTDFQNSIPS